MATTTTANWQVYALPIGYLKNYEPPRELIYKIQRDRAALNRQYSIRRAVTNFIRIGFGLSPIEERLD